MKSFRNKFAEWEFKTFYIDTALDAEKVLKELRTDTLYGLDIETAKIEEFRENKSAGLCPLLSKIRLLQIYDGLDKVYVFDLFKIPVDIFKDLLSKGRFVAHNAVFEISHLTHAGIPNMNVGCSMLISQLIDGAEHSPFEPVEDEEDDEDKSGLSVYGRTSHSLDAVIQRLFTVKVDKKQQVSEWAAEELSTEQITYAALDAVLTYKAARALEPKLIEYKMGRHYKLLKDMQHVVAEMQRTGVVVDWNYHAKLLIEWKEKEIISLKKCNPFFGEVNMRSGKQMGEWLVKYVKDKKILAEWPKTKRGSYAFGRTALVDFKELPAIAALLEYKKWAKLLDSFGESLSDKRHPVTNRLHPSYTLGQTRTGRLSSRNPNIQQQPHDPAFRKLFKAPDGYLIVAGDFIQIELQLQAFFSKDPVMNKVFKEGGDIYKTTAGSILGVPIEKVTDEQRTVGKVLALSLGFGMGPKKLGSYALNGFGLKKSDDMWKEAHKGYHELFGVYSAWCNMMRERTSQLGYSETITGMRRRLIDDEQYTASVNTCIQGSASALMMHALLIAKDKIGNLGQILATVHDEILILCKKEIAPQIKDLLTNSMNEAMKLLFPNAVNHHVAKVKIGETWAEAK